VEEGRLIISDYKLLDCEHAYGPSFIPSPRDRARLTELIASVKSLGDAGQPRQPKQNELASELTKVRADLDEEIQRNRKMQKSVDFLAKQFHDQQRTRLLNQAPDNKK
jgi:hypothetical protein